MKYIRKVYFQNTKLPKLVAVSKKQEDYKIDNALGMWTKNFW